LIVDYELVAMPLGAVVEVSPVGSVDSLDGGCRLMLLPFLLLLRLLRHQALSNHPKSSL
jgi:hypothetical protein